MNLSEIIDLYQCSNDFIKNIRAKTQKDYLLYLKIIKRNFGDYTIRKISHDMFPRQAEEFLNTMQDTPRKASYLLSVLKLIFKWALDQRIIKVNQSIYIRFKRSSPPQALSWTKDLLEYVDNNFPPELREYMIFATETGLRRCDLIRLRKSHHLKYENGIFKLVIEQQKTNKIVSVTISDHLLNYILERNSQNDFFLTSANKEPWNEHKFNSAWKRQRSKALLHHGITLPRPHNFRKVAGRQVLEAGASAEQAADMLGIDLNTFQQYYHEKGAISHIAIEKLNIYRERKEKTFKSFLYNKLHGFAQFFSYAVQS